jgi:type IV pilus assembly protein PilQ
MTEPAMNSRNRTSRWSPLASLMLPLASLLLVEASLSADAFAGPPKQGAARSVDAGLNELDGLEVEELADGSTVLRLVGSTKPTFNVYKLGDPERLVVDVSSAARGKVVPRVPVDTWAVGRVTIDSKDENGARVARVVVDLKRDSSWVVVPNENVLVVTITPREAAPETYFARKSAGKRKAEIEAMQRDAEAMLADAKTKASDADDAAIAAEKRAKAAESRADAAEKELEEARTQSGLLTKKRREQIAAQQAKLEKAKSEADAARKAAQASKADAIAAREAVEAETAALRAEAAEAKQQAAAARADKAAVEKDAKATAARAAKMLATAEKALEDARAERSKAQVARKKAQEELTTAKNARKTASAERKKQADADVATAEAAEKDARERAEAAASRIKKLEKDRDALDTLLAEQAAKAEKLAKSIESKEAELAALEEKLAAAKAEKPKPTLASTSGGPVTRKAAEDSAAQKQAEAAQKKAAEAAQKKLDEVRDALAAENEKLAALQEKVAAAEQSLGDTLAAKQDAVLAKGPKKTRPATKVTDVRYEHGEDEVRVVVDVDGPMVYSGSTLSPGVRALAIQGASLPNKLERSLDTSSFAGPVGMISSFVDEDEVRVLVSTKGTAAPFLEEQPGRLVWHFPKSGKAGKRKAGEPEVVSLAGTEVAGFSTPPGLFAPPSGSAAFGKKQKWRGERIDIELQDAPIKDVLLLFSDIGRVNIIAGDGVDGTVTMRLTAVPWDQALDIILRSLGLGMVQEGNVVRVATTDALEKERKEAIERANAQVQLKPLETRLVPLSYSTTDEMIPKVQSVMSSRGSVTPDSRTNTLIIMDVAENLALAEQLISQLDSQTPQVLIEARIVEARTSWLRQLGIQWGFDYTASAGTGNPTGLFFPNSLGFGGGSGGQGTDTRGLLLPGAAASPNYAVDLPAPVGPGAGGALGFSFGSLDGNLNTNLRLSAAEDEGEVRIISAPKIVTLDNTEAQIEQGVQIPISQVSAAGVNTRYVNATLALRVTPHVTNEGSVLLNVQVQKNEADFVNTGARGDPTILTKQAQSRMLITDGDTAVIGGIFTRNQSVNRKKVPWIADVPIIGWFFKNKTETDTRSEVLIFLTPKIVNRSTSIGG